VSAIPIRATRDTWVVGALAALPQVLVDHAHCERKAAQTALKLMARYTDRPSVQTQLSRLAREELVHFERVLRELAARDIPFGPQSSGGYAAALFAEVESPGDELLCSALIEARSHERFVRLAEAVPDPGLKALYEDLLEAEERHGQLYLELHADLCGAVSATRLEWLCAAEDEIVHRPRQPVRMHSGG
jgi:tRNA 2-(methylsulfanyl)-N6-isopentenyladenosine37 hydroxylase